EGSLTSLTGISGSGKTTILELASGLLQADTGTVFANERPVLCQQNCNDCISEEFVCDDVALSIRANYTNEERTKKVKKAMDMVGLPFSQFAERKTSSLSHGQRRLLSIANAIASDSSILLFDEPTAGLDGIERERILFLLASLAESGKTVLFTTHSKEEADFSEREITMIDGAIINDTVNVFRFPKRNEKIQVLNLAKSQNQKKLNVCKEIKGIAFINWLRKISLNLTGQRKNESLIARLPSITKIILFFALLVFTFASSTWPFCVCAFAFALLYVGLSRYFFSHLIKSFFISIPFVLFRFIFQLLFQTVEVGENILWSCNFLSISKVSITVLLCTLLKTWSFVACILSFVYTSSEYDIIKGLRILLKPFSILRFQVSFIIIIAQLIFKFVFFLADESYSIVKNQLIRGKLLYAKGTFKRLKIYLSLLPTILCSTLRRAENFVCALSERCFYE
ncbi:MAG: ATP-binding cassette domain-containing protein, partial [Treponema sp.]|nr:ATP-binding cassette domain-containing protein [Treponema sp.]